MSVIVGHVQLVGQEDMSNAREILIKNYGLIDALLCNPTSEIAMVKTDKRVEGIAICRKFVSQPVIGPIIACNAMSALYLIGFFSNRYPGGIRVDRVVKELGDEAFLQLAYQRTGGGIPMTLAEREMAQQGENERRGGGWDGGVCHR